MNKIDPFPLFVMFVLLFFALLAGLLVGLVEQTLALFN
jgi:hypothetical protein